LSSGYLYGVPGEPGLVENSTQVRAGVGFDQEIP
jgi:hypothetical protein